MKKAATSSKGRKGGGNAPAPSHSLVKHGWVLYAHPLLLDQLELLAGKAAKERNPQGDATKVLAWLTRAIFDEIPRDPTLKEYRQGHTLGKGNTHWFRDKYAGQFRLFFRYDSRAKIIIFGWANDENTLRARESKDDAYATFRRMLSGGNPPGEWIDLLEACSTKDAVGRLKRRSS